MPRSLVRALVLLVVLVPGLALAACGGGAATPAASLPPGAVVITADARKFDTAELVIPADAPFTLAFVNKDAELHNLAIRTKAGLDGDVLLRFDPVGASTKVIEAGPIAAGTYFFQCEIHPEMKGTVIAR